MTLRRVVGVDPGLTRCGIAIIDGVRGSVTPIAVDVIRSSPDIPIAERLVHLYDEARSICERYHPHEIAIERVFTQHNKNTAMGTAMAAGVIAVAAAQQGLPVSFYTPTEVKTAVTGHGKADKKQVTMMVTRILGLAQEPQPADAADALAIALCHHWKTKLADYQPSSGASDPIGMMDATDTDEKGRSE